MMSGQFKTILTIMTASAVMATNAAAADVTIENFIGRVNIETAPGQPLQIIKKDRADSVDITTAADSIIVDGKITQLSGESCSNSSYVINYNWFRKSGKNVQKSGGYKDLDEYPELTIRGPQDLNLTIDNAIIFGFVDTINSADVSINYCGKLEFEDIIQPSRFKINGSGDISANNTNDLDISRNGSGDVSVNSSGNIKIRNNGSGDFTAQKVASLSVENSGSGDISVETVTGSVSVNNRGSGDIEIGSVNGSLEYFGRGSGDFELERIDGNVSLKSQGSGDIEVGTVTGEAEIVLNGSGDAEVDYLMQGAFINVSGSGGLDVDRINGNATIRLNSSGNIEIDDGDVGLLKVENNNSGDFSFGGTAAEAELMSSNSGDIYVRKVVGKADVRRSNSGEIRVGN